MVTFLPGWSRPSTILFATECPIGERTSTFALAQAKESNASLIILHVCEETPKLPSLSGRARELSCARKELLKPMVQHARELGIRCRMEVRNGIASDEILEFLKERRVDRVVMGVHTPGPIGKLLVGSVAETLLRKADVPVTVVGPYSKPGTYRDFLTRTIVCRVSSHRSSGAVARFAAELALRTRAQLVLQYVVSPQECEEVLRNHPLDQMEEELLDLIPPKVRARLNLRAMAQLGDPIEELLYLGRVQQANLIVMGAYNATHFAAVSNSGILYKVLAYAPCPVITLSPVVLADYGPTSETIRPTQVNYLPGVI